MAYSSCECATSQPSTSDQKAADAGASAQSRVIIFSSARLMLLRPATNLSSLLIRCGGPAFYASAMADWTNATPTTTTAGVLLPRELARFVDTTRVACDPAVRPWVEYLWCLRWNLADGQEHGSQVLPHPSCSLTVERGETRPEVAAGAPVVVTGVVTRRFDVTLRGSGWVLGLKFRPGGMTALTGLPAHEVTDRVVPADGLVPAAVVDAMAGIDGPDSPAAAARSVEQALLAHAPAPDRRYLRLLEVIGDMLDDRSLVSVADVERRHGVEPRTLQRWFRHYVGVGPKWVLARYRMHDVVTILDAGHDGSLTDLAHEFGWYDQSHFVRDFVALVGRTPGDYRAASQRQPEAQRSPVSRASASRSSRSTSAG